MVSAAVVMRLAFVRARRGALASRSAVSMRTAWCAVTVAWEVAKRGPEVWSGRSLPRVRPVSESLAVPSPAMSNIGSPAVPKPMRATHELHEGIGRRADQRPARKDGHQAERHGQVAVGRPQERAGQSGLAAAADEHQGVEGLRGPGELQERGGRAPAERVPGSQEIHRRIRDHRDVIQAQEGRIVAEPQLKDGGRILRDLGEGIGHVLAQRYVRLSEEAGPIPRRVEVVGEPAIAPDRERR